MSELSRAALNLAPLLMAEHLKACVRRARILGCRVVAITDDASFHDPDNLVLDRLAEGEFDLVIMRAGASVEATHAAFDRAPEKP